MELDDSDHHAHCILGTVYTFMREYDLAHKHLGRALALNPNDANSLANASMAFSLLGEHDAALEAAETAVRLDPYHPDWYLAVLGLAHFMARDHERAIQVMETAPDGLCDTRAYLVAACAHAGHTADAARHAAAFLRASAERMGGTPEADGKRYMKWLLDTNPFREAADAAHFADGLGKAGLTS